VLSVCAVVWVEIFKVAVAFPTAYPKFAPTTAAGSEVARRGFRRHQTNYSKYICQIPKMLHFLSTGE
jgi:hypothetical protein